MNQLPNNDLARAVRRSAAVDRSESLFSLSLSKRPRTRLLAAGIDTVGKLSSTSAAQLLSLPSFGNRSLAEVHDRLDEYLMMTSQERSEDIEVDPSSDKTIVEIRRVATLAFENGVTTIGELAAALASPATAWLSDRDQFLAMAIEPIVDPSLASHFGWEAAVEGIYANFSESARAGVLDTVAVRTGGRRTLEAVGEDFGVTRERIRQLRVKVCTAMIDHPVIAAAVDQLVELVGWGCPEAVLTERGFNPAESATQTLLAVASNKDLFLDSLWREEVAGEYWLGAGCAPEGWICAKVKSVGGVVSVAGLDEAFGDRYPNAATSVVHALLSSASQLRVVGSNVLDWSGSMLDKSISALTHFGVPMTDAELIELVEPTTDRSLLNQLQAERKHGSRIVLTTDREWALPGWAVDEYQRGEDLMVHIIENAGGSVSLRRLKKEVHASGGFAPTSVQMWATMSPRFVSDGHVVRCRLAHEQIPIPSPWESNSMFRRVDDPNPGSWSTVLSVDYAAIRASSTLIALPFAGLLDIDFEEERTIRCGAIHVAVSWRMSSVYLHSSTGWRDVCEELGAEDGDYVVFSACGAGTAAAWVPESRAAEASSPMEIVRSMIGGTGIENILADAAWAVGLDGELDEDFTLDDLNAHLTHRRDHEMRNALVAIHPELEL